MKGKEERDTHRHTKAETEIYLSLSLPLYVRQIERGREIKTDLDR